MATVLLLRERRRKHNEGVDNNTDGAEGEKSEGLTGELSFLFASRDPFVPAASFCSFASFSFTTLNVRVMVAI